MLVDVDDPPPHRHPHRRHHLVHPNHQCRYPQVGVRILSTSKDHPQHVQMLSVLLTFVLMTLWMNHKIPFEYA